MWILVALALSGLALKIWAAHRLKQFRYMPGAGACLIFILITYAQTVVELYVYFSLYEYHNVTLIILKLYFVLVMGTVLYLPTVIDVVVLRRINLAKPLIFISVWAAISTTILLTDQVIAGIQVLAYNATRIPGPYYGIIPIVGLIAIIYSVLRLIKIVRSAEEELVRTKAYNMTAGIALLVAVSLLITVLMRLGVQINMAGILPLSIGILVFVMAEQFNDVRIFDLRAITPFTKKWRRLWSQTRHIHTISVDPAHCRGLMEDYTDSLIEAAEKVCTSQRDIASYVGVSQATVSRRTRKHGYNQRRDKAGRTAS